MSNLPYSRRGLLRIGLGSAAAAFLASSGETAPEGRKVDPPKEIVKAFNIDFNWDNGAASPPGTYAHADPKEHMRFYQEMGVNTIQTFCVTYNGYAWFPSEVAPVTPGLKRNFLGEMVSLGHQARIKVYGYFCLGANPFWEGKHPEEVHGSDSDYIKAPLTLKYLDYFSRSVQDALRKTDIDGFMVDWVRPPKHTRWLECERGMYRELMGEPFPASGSPSAEATLEYDRRSLARAWKQLKQAVRSIRPARIWTNHPFERPGDPLWNDHPLLKEVDWLLNESPDQGLLGWLERNIGPRTRILQNLCGWADHDASAWKKLDPRKFGLYGFAQADRKTTLPSAENAANIKNIEALREAYHAL
ncbi:MAG: hypothetical protein IT210_05270 [Armatimonadetes bacterium]|nr:hypothetical protein [Armatimonadota bacterium]